MKTCANFEQTGDTPFDTHFANGRFRNPAQNFQQCRFAGSVAANDPDDFTFLNLK